MEWGSEWGKAPHSMCPFSERGMGRHSVWPAPAGSLVSPGFPSHSSGHPRVGLLSFLQKPDPTKIPLPYSLPRLPACRRRTHLRCRGVRMAIPSGEKHALSGAPKSGVLIFVGSGFALRAAANLPRVAVRRMAPREAFRCGESPSCVMAGGPVELVNGPGRRLGLDAARKSRICGSRQAGGQPSRT